MYVYLKVFLCTYECMYVHMHACMFVDGHTIPPVLYNWSNLQGKSSPRHRKPIYLVNFA